MGWQLVQQTTALTGAGSLPGLSDSARLCLQGMATVAHDKGQPPDTPAACYWGGWEYLATFWLGYPKYTNAAKLRTARAVAELVDAGLVAPMGRWGGSRGPRMYRLNVWLVNHG